MTIINLTPHDLNIHVDGVVTIPASGEVARVSTSVETVGDADGIPLFKTTFGEVEGLPAPREGVLLVVSAIIRAACPDRSDLWSPGKLVRDDAGRVVGCGGLTR